MPKTVLTENPGKDVCRYLNIGPDTRLVEDALARYHTGVSADRRRRTARSAALSILQGLEFLDSASGSSLLTRPLPLFYAVENIVKGVALVLDPTLDTSDFRAHGLSGDKSKRYSVKNFICRVQKPGSDVWSRAHRLLNADWIKLPIVEDGESVVSAWRSAVPSKPLTGGALRFGDLARQIPELADDVVVAGWGTPFVVHVPTFKYRVTTSPPSTSLRVRLRHAHNQATRAMIVKDEKRGLAGFTRGVDKLDVIEYSITSPATSVSAPSPKCDIFGSMYMSFAPSAVELGELLVHPAALFILSDVVRYQPDQWARLLDDHPDEAILVERYLDVAARKVPNIALINELEHDYFEFKVGT